MLDTVPVRKKRENIRCSLQFDHRNVVIQAYSYVHKPVKRIHAYRLRKSKEKREAQYGLWFHSVHVCMYFDMSICK